MSEYKLPSWALLAMSEIGVMEINGRGHNKRILEYGKSVTNIDITDDETAWCSSFMNWLMHRCGYQKTNSALARSWLLYGETLFEFRRWCIVIFKRGTKPWQGHVTLGSHIDGSYIVCVGGNQGDAVSECSYPVADVLGYRWPIEI